MLSFWIYFYLNSYFPFTSWKEFLRRVFSSLITLFISINSRFYWFKLVRYRFCCSITDWLSLSCSYWDLIFYYKNSVYLTDSLNSVRCLCIWLSDINSSWRFYCISFLRDEFTSYNYKIYFFWLESSCLKVKF